MNYRLKALLLLLVLSGLLVSTRTRAVAIGFAQSQQQNISVTTGEGAAMRSLRMLLNAETTFQSTVGKGEYGQLKELADANIIDKTLGSGLKDGYRFTVVIKKSTMTTHPAIDLVARPIVYGKNERRSFYLTEAGVMLTSLEKDAPLTSMQPFAGGGGATKATEPKSEGTVIDDPDADAIAIDISANETSVIATLLAIQSAQTKYFGKAGAGSYGTLEQLEKAGLIDKTQSVAAQNGYLLELKINAAKPDSPATFSLSAIPQTYGNTGRNSFFIEQAGGVRGADKEGGPADASDALIK